MFTAVAQLSNLYAGGATMAERLDPKEIVTLEDLALSNLWEVTMPVIDLP